MLPIKKLLSHFIFFLSLKSSAYLTLREHLSSDQVHSVAVVNSHPTGRSCSSAGQFCNYLPQEANSKFPLSRVNLNLGTEQDCKLTLVATSPITLNPRDGTEIDRSVKTENSEDVCVCTCVDKQGLMGPMGPTHHRFSCFGCILHLLPMLGFSFSLWVYKVADTFREIQIHREK